MQPLFDRPAASASVLPVALRDVVYEAGGKRLVDGLSFRIEPGRRTVVMGPNGAGKSLALRIVQGLIEPTGGTVTWSGANAAEGRRRTAIVLQRPVLLRRSVVANLRHALSVYGVASAEQPGKARRLLEAAGLEDLATTPARLLSGGEQQRLAIVRALAAEPELLLLDEPTASLDPHSTSLVERLVLDAHAAGTTVAFISHDAGQARRMAEDVVFLHKGRAVEVAPADRFFAGPASQEARAYLAGRLLL